jgi:hypothetical protein
MTNPRHLAVTDAVELKEIRAACPRLDATARNVRDFADMMRDLRDDDLPALHSLVNGMKRDLDAVTAGLSTPWSSEAFRLPFGRLDQSNMVPVRVISRQPGHNGRASAESNAPSPECDCLAHRFGNAADGPERVRCYGSDLTEAQWQVVRPLLPVPAWLQGRGSRPEGFCHRVMLDQCHEVKALLAVSRLQGE